MASETPGYPGVREGGKEGGKVGGKEGGMVWGMDGGREDGGREDGGREEGRGVGRRLVEGGLLAYCTVCAYKRTCE